MQYVRSFTEHVEDSYTMLNRAVGHVGKRL